MTKNDILNENADLLQHAASILDTRLAFTLDAKLADGPGGSEHQVTVTTGNLDRLDILVNGRPRLSNDVSDGPHTIMIPTSGSATMVELRGFRADALVAAARLPLAPPAPRPIGAPASPASSAPSTSIQALMRVSAKDRDRAWLKESLREAIQLEFSTIPPYLCGYWSIDDDSDPVAGILYSVVLEEMLHMGLMCNLLAGMKEKPPINSKAFVPAYPSELPGGVHPGLSVGLVGLSIPLVRDTFMEIERPENPLPVGAARMQTFCTIGEFYDALLDCFRKVNPKLDPAWQRAEGTVGLDKITDMAGVERAINLIKEQGEGTSQSAFNGSDPAHYYRFKQIVDEKFIIPGPGGKAVYGDPLPFPAVTKMAEVPKGGWQDAEVSRPFNKRFTAMLALMADAWSNDDTVGDKKLSQAIKVMRELTKLARDLMKKPLPGGNGFYGPSFLFEPESPTAGGS
jgi:hypothetical protein